jgi:short-subunit dehydrogenase
MKFKNKTVFITGASAGIGKALAVEFAKQGANLILAARRLDRLETLSQDLEKYGVKTACVPCDVTTDGELENAVKMGVKELGKIDVVIANAGYHVSGKLETLTLDDYRRQFETNVFGVLRTAYATLDELKKSQGSLVLIGSVAGYVSLPKSSAYTMSKAAIHALSRSLSHELSPYGIRVTLIAPGYVVSDIREVDNLGVHHPGDSDPKATLFRMETSKAARQIVHAIACQRREEVITLHGKAAVFLQRHFPQLMSTTLNWTYQRSKKKNLKQSRHKN